MSRQIAVIGIGRFGESLCLELMQQGAEVFAVDSNEELINEIAPLVTHAVIADTTNEAIVKELNLEHFDSVFVAIGDDIKASILTTLILKEAGVKNIWVKSKDKFHQKILLKVGADHVINPEKDMGKRVSRHLLTNLFFDYLDIGDGIAICEVEISAMHQGREINPMTFYDTHNVRLLGVKRQNQLIPTFDQTICLQQKDIAILAGSHPDIKIILTKI